MDWLMSLWEYLFGVKSQIIFLRWGLFFNRSFLTLDSWGGNRVSNPGFRQVIQEGGVAGFQITGSYTNWPQLSSQLIPCILDVHIYPSMHRNQLLLFKVKCWIFLSLQIPSGVLAWLFLLWRPWYQEPCFVEFLHPVGIVDCRDAFLSCYVWTS